ncbi:MAG TPA: EAL domain-containing protein, partial [Conexibacter sp.]|nr:EAL domain-containing protein [Conexibacter sp.]
DAADVGRVDAACGHAAGERTLTALEQRLHPLLPGAPLLRIARERFVATAETGGEPAEALELARALATAAREPLLVEEIDVRLDVAVGVALAHDGRALADALLRDADAAARQARHAGEPAWRIADVGAHERALRRLRLAGELTRALARGELALYFQPIVSLRRGTLLGIEALVRWRHPDRGLLGPAQFLPVAEESGLIVEIGDWMLSAVCAQVGRWSAARPERALPPVSLNVSARELRDETFARRFADTLLDAQVPPEAIALEITDPGPLGEHADVEEGLAALRRLGVRIVLDRFGGPHSSLVHLARLPVDGLKLDGSLLAGGDGAHGERAIAEAVVTLAHALGLSVTVPGIESERQLAAVRALHVDAVQGHLIAQPAPATTLADLDQLELVGRTAAGGGAGTAEAADELLPLSAVADALGVSPSTVRRLADQGVLPGTRTEGGHRRFRRADVQRLARERQRIPALRPWELPDQPLPVTAELLADHGAALAERAARALYDPQRPGWFAAPHGLLRARGWLDALRDALAAGRAQDGLAATAAYADAAALGGASAAEVVRFLGQFGGAASHELLRVRGGAQEARGLQRLMSAAAEAFVSTR